MRNERWYGVVETEASSEGEGEAPLGKLSVAQIEKGKAVLETIKGVLGLEAEAEAEAAVDIARLSGEYYTLIPTALGRTAPPPLATLEMVEEKAASLACRHFSRGEVEPW